MSSETEAKHLRGKLLFFQLWMERQVELGLLDIEKTPICFDRTRNSLKEIQEKTTNSHCHWCFHKFEPNEPKVTDNHIMFFHPGCKEKYEKMEDTNEQFEQRG